MALGLHNWTPVITVHRRTLFVQAKRSKRIKSRAQLGEYVMRLGWMLLLVGCGAPNVGSDSSHSGQSYEAAMRLVCIEGPALVAQETDLIQAAADYGRFLRVNVTNAEAKSVIRDVARAPREERGAIVDAAAVRAGMANCEAFPLR